MRLATVLLLNSCDKHWRVHFLYSSCHVSLFVLLYCNRRHSFSNHDNQCI